MAHLIRNNPHIKGIKMGSEVEHIISQFADDTNLFLMYSESCINAAISTLVHIENSTGLKISYKKTKIYRIGSLRHSNAKCYTVKPISWSDGDIDMLGVVISNAEKQNTKGFYHLLNKVENVSKTWYNCSLTWIGKCLVINVLMSSIFVYQMIIALLISKKQEEHYYEIIKDFLWKSKPKIPKGVLQNSKKQGGLKLAKIREKQIALHIQLIAKIKDDHTFDYVYDLLLPNMQEYLWECNMHPTDVKMVIKTQSFWRDTLELWASVHHHSPQDVDEVLSQIIWYNSHIKSGCAMFRMPKDGVIIKIKDLLDENNELISYEQFQNEYTMSLSWLSYTQLVNAIPVYWEILLKDDESSLLQAPP